MKPLLLLTSYLLLLTSLLPLSAQQYSYGIDPQRDSAAFAHFRVRMDSIRVLRPTVALVLSGGGAKGAAHVSVIRYLDSIGLRPDLVVGTSIGGLVGGLYACGYTGDQMADIFLDQSWDSLLRDLHSSRYKALDQKDLDRQLQLSVTFGSFNSDFFNRSGRISNLRRQLIGGGVVDGQNIYNLLGTIIAGYADERDFLRMPTPFVCVAADMVSARPKIWHSGRLIDALRSTMSIPALFNPVKQDDMVLLDGAMRNNFPVDVARELGADIVIGVDISAPPLDADHINTLLDIVYQTTDVLGRETYDAAVRSTDIYIKPDLHEFSLLSFNTQAIQEIMLRGRQALTPHASQLDSLALTRNTSHTSHHSPFTIHHSPDTLNIVAVSFIGVNPKAEHYLRQLLHLPSRITTADLYNAVDIMMGTKVFESVTFQLLGPHQPYVLLFNCKPAAVNRLGIGIRFDTKDMGAILFHAGFNTQSLTGSQLSLQGRLGQRSALNMHYGLRTRGGWDLGAEAMGEYVRNGDFAIDTFNFQITFTHSRAQLFLDVNRWRKMNIRVGAFLDHWHRYSFLSDYRINELGTLRTDFLSYAVFLRLRSDSFDDPYYPNRGVRTQVEADLHLGSTIAALAFGQASCALSIGPVALLPSVTLRYSSSQLPLPYRNAIAIYRSSPILMHQTAFIGLNQATFCLPFMATASADLRINIFASHYISLLGQALYDTDFNGNSQKQLGVGIEYSYRTPVGPFAADLHWSTFTHSFGGFLSIGFDI